MIKEEKGNYYEEIICEPCMGTGIWLGDDCIACYGTGISSKVKLTKEETQKYIDSIIDKTVEESIRKNLKTGINSRSIRKTIDTLKKNLKIQLQKNENTTRGNSRRPR